MASPYSTLSLALGPDKDAFFKVHVTRLLGAEYVPFVEDVVRMVSIQATIQLMVFLSGGGSFFTADFLMLVVYVVLGVMLYWLVMRKVFAFV